MKLPLILHPDAQVEFDEAFDWFDQFGAGGGAAFVRTVQATFDVIAAHPRMHAVIAPDIRRAPVSGYPYYRVIYRERGGRVEVLSVFHTSRDPADWQSRV